MPERVVQYVIKAKQLFEVVYTTDGPLTVCCNDSCCVRKPRQDRYRILPCSCHATIVQCRCEFADTVCGACGRCYITVGDTWYEIRDPHYDNGLHTERDAE